MTMDHTWIKIVIGVTIAAAGSKTIATGTTNLALGITTRTKMDLIRKQIMCAVKITVMKIGIMIATSGTSIAIIRAIAPH